MRHSGELAISVIPPSTAARNMSSVMMIIPRFLPKKSATLAEMKAPIIPNKTKAATVMDHRSSRVVASRRRLRSAPNSSGPFLEIKNKMLHDEQN